MFTNSLFFYIFLLLIKTIKPLANCTEGLNSCIKCNPITKLCEDCGFDVFIPDDKGGCKGSKICKIGYNFCSECDSDNKLCKICERGYIPDENGGCSLSNNCEVSYKGSCLKCFEDFFPVGIDLKICKSLDSNDLNFCKEINTETGACKTCEDGFFLNSGDNLCSTYENCHESLFGVCYKCNESYYLDISQEKCVIKNGTWVYCQQTLDGKTCDKCEKNNFFDDYGNCTGIKYCSEAADYENFAKCNKCKEGYYDINFGDLCAKDSRCADGDKTLGICTVCHQHFYIDFKDGLCYSNEEDNDYKYCSKVDGECLECASGKYLGEDKRCSFSKDCAESYLGNCIHCVKDFHLGRDNICTNVDKCIHSNIYFECDECELGYVSNYTSKTCVKEIPGYENCQNTDNTGNCSQCRIDFYLNKTDNLCYTNLDKNSDFYKCAITYDGVTCFNCIEDYWLGYLDNKCTKVEGCEISESEDRCLQCDSEMYCLNRKTGLCMYNQGIEKEEEKIYFNCNITNEEGDKCEICLPGYRVNNKGLCENEDNCQIFDENNHCAKCEDDDDAYEFDNYCMNDDIGCVLADPRWCDKCDNITNLNMCTKCDDGFILENGKCLNITLSLFEKMK